MNLRNFLSGRTIGFIVLIIVLGLVAAFYAFNNYIYEEKQGEKASNYKDAEYIIEGKRVKIIGNTKYFGNELFTDFDGDGREDVVFLITDQPGGSGTFYYVVAALNTSNGYVGSEALLLGDRIAPQTTEKGKGKIIIVNYADRAPGEPFTTSPSVGKSIWLLLDPETLQFGEVAQDFEGEANPASMSLSMKTWVWTTNSKFTLTFANQGKFSATTDCNSMGGSYVAKEKSISFSNIFSTKMYCADSQESIFSSLLQNTESYEFTSRGELVFHLKSNSGSVIFK